MARPTNHWAQRVVLAADAWSTANYARPIHLPLVNVAAVFVLLPIIVPVYLSARLTRHPAAIGRT